MDKVYSIWNGSILRNRSMNIQHQNFRRKWLSLVHYSIDLCIEPCRKRSLLIISMWERKSSLSHCSLGRPPTNTLLPVQLGQRLRCSHRSCHGVCFGSVAEPKLPCGSCKHCRELLIHPSLDVDTISAYLSSVLKLQRYQPREARSRSALSMTMYGQLPPSSSVAALSPSVHCFATNLLARGDPVNATLLTRGCLQRALYHNGVLSRLVVMTVKIPGPKADFSARYARLGVEKGVSGDGLTTMGQPAASAAAAFLTPLLLGNSRHKTDRDSNWFLDCKDSLVRG